MLDTSTCNTIKHAQSDFNTCDAALDTLELYFENVRPREQLQRLRKLGEVKKCRNKENTYIWGLRLIVQHPSLEELQQLDVLQRELKGILTRVDLALNHSGLPVSKGDILRHLILRWRRAGLMRDIGNGFYWCRFTPGKRPPPRNLLLYDDRINKSTGELKCTHLELRLLRARTLRANGIKNLQDVINLNPQKLFNRHTKWVDCDDACDAFELKVIRKAIEEDRQRSQGRETSEFTDRYRARIQYRVKDLLQRTGQNRAQVVRDRNPKRPMKEMSNPLQIPTSLTFPKSKD